MAQTIRPYLSRRQFDKLFAELGPLDWRSMRHSHGDGSKLPDEIRAWLTTRSEQKRQAMWEHFWAALQYQGSIFEPTAPVTRLVAGALPLQRDDGCALDLVMWLADMARGYTMTEGQGLLKWVPEGSEKRPEVEQQYERELGWVRAVQSAVWCAYGPLVRLLRDNPYRKLQIHVPHALTGVLVEAADGSPGDMRVADAASDVSAILRDRFAATDDPLVRAGYVFALGELQYVVPANAEFLERLLGPSGEASAAIAAIYLAHTRPGPAVADALARALERREEHGTWFPDDVSFPWFQGHFRFVLVGSIACGKLSDEDLGRALPAVLDLLRTTVSHYTVDCEVALILRRVFGVPGNGDRAKLDERQRRVLGALHENEAFWNPTSGNVDRVMGRFGLENDRALVGRLLAES